MTNIHGNHVASCYCCKNLSSGYEGDWSDVTPGRGAYCDCIKGHFYSSGAEVGEKETQHNIFMFAQNCPDFEPEDERNLETE